MSRFSYGCLLVVVLIFAAHSCQQAAPPPGLPLPPINPADLVGRWKSDQFGVWEFTIEPSGAQRFTWDEPVFGTRGFVGHWLLEHRRLRLPDLQAANPLARWFGVNTNEVELQKFLNELEIRHLNLTTLIIGQAGSANPEDQLTFQRE
jgi:hypothetical protein